MRLDCRFSLLFLLAVCDLPQLRAAGPADRPCHSDGVIRPGYGVALPVTASRRHGPGGRGVDVAAAPSNLRDVYAK